MEVPRIIINVRLAAFRIQGDVLELEFTEGCGKVIYAARYGAKVKPNAFKGLLVQRSAGEIISIFGRQNDLLGRCQAVMQKGIGILGAVFVGKEKAVIAVGYGHQGAHHRSAVYEEAVLEGNLIHTKAVDHLIEFGKTNLGGLIVRTQTEGTVIQLIPIGLGQAFRAITR